MTDLGNPILEPLHRSEQTQQWRSSEGPKPKTEPKIPAAIQRIIGELGLRYRPSATADLEAHAATLALLCRDLADLPPHLLERAAREWAVRSPYLPKASDLAGMCRDLMPSAKPKASRDDWLRAKAEEANRNLALEGKSEAMLWIVDGAGMRLVDPKYPSFQK